MDRGRAVIDAYQVSDGSRTGAFALKRWYIPAVLLLLFLALLTVVFAGEPAEREYRCGNKEGVLLPDSNSSDEACEAADSEMPSYRDASMTENQIEGEEHGKQATND